LVSAIEIKELFGLQCVVEAVLVVLLVVENLMRLDYLGKDQRDELLLLWIGISLEAYPVLSKTTIGLDGR